jgi:hypothetical protein
MIKLVVADLAPAYISGRITLRGRRHCAHGGIIVRVTGTTYQTSTRNDGRFDLEAAPARGMTLTYAREGYAPKTTDAFSLQAGESLERTDDIMNPVTGSVTGAVVLTPFSNAERQERVSIDFAVRRMAPPEGEVDCDEGPRREEQAEEPAEGAAEAPPEDGVSWASIGDPSVLVDGGFLRPDLAPGEYRVTISAQGYQPVTIGTRIQPAEDEIFSDITLFHLSRVDAVGFSGQVTLETADDHNGARVLLIGEDALVIGEALTDVNGEFSIDAAFDETYTVQVIPPTGYALPVEGIGALYTWNDTSAQFLDPNDARFALELPALPGSITAAVRLTPFSAADRVEAVQVVVQPMAGGEGPAAVWAAETQTLGVADVQPGEYQVVVSALGYVSETVPVTVEPATPTDLGTITLVHRSQSEPTAFTGTITKEAGATGQPGWRHHR